MSRYESLTMGSWEEKKKKAKEEPSGKTRLKTLCFKFYNAIQSWLMTP